MNKEEIIISFENIYNGNIFNQRKILARYEANMKTRDHIKLSKVPCDQIIGPLNCNQYSNVYIYIHGQFLCFKIIYMLQNIQTALSPNNPTEFVPLSGRVKSDNLIFV